MMNGMTIDAKDAERLIKRMVKVLDRQKLDEHVHEFAVQAQRRLVNSIWQQTLDFYPLSVSYKHRKKRAGLDTRTLIATHSYLAAIRVQKVRGGWAVTLGTRRTKNGIPMASLAEWLEYGTKRMKPRPHWRPLAHWAETAWKEYMKGQITSRVRRS